MVTKEGLQKKYSTYSNHQLMDIIERKFDYTDLAVSVAVEELGKRNISEAEIKDYKELQIEKARDFIKKYVYDDLTFLQKNLFYFLWIPVLNFAFKMNYREDGYLLKLKQSKYYSFLGFIFFMLSGFISGYFELSTSTSVGLWITGFIFAYTYDEYFNRNRQIETLQRKFGRNND